MNATQPIIDVTPVEYSSAKTGASKASSSSYSSTQANTGSWKSHGYSYGSQQAYQQNAGYRSSSHSEHYRQPGWKASSAPGQTQPGSAYTRFEAAPNASGSALAGLAQIALGTGLVLVGIPMLILPGPGLLSILAGTALAASGTRKLFAPTLAA